MASYKLKIVAAGWEGFTGPLCAVNFTDGVSDETLSRLQIDRIAAIIQCDLVDASGTDVGQAGAAVREANRSGVEAPVEGLDTMTPEELAAERKRAMDEMLKNPASKLYTEAELEDIADKTGIKGVREIGDKWGVKERAIGKLIFLILQAQSEYMANVAKRDAAEKAKRDAALAESIAKQQARETEVDKVARVLTPDPAADQTPNAIGSDGTAVFTDPNPKPEIDPSLQKDPAAETVSDEGPVDETQPQTEGNDS